MYYISLLPTILFGISIQLQRANQMLSCQEMEYGLVDTIIWVKQLFHFENKTQSASNGSADCYRWT